MKQISLYNTIEELTDKTLCQLVEKCYYSGSKVVVLVSNIEAQEKLNKLLWTYSQKHFIPHGSSLDPLPEQQPIYITSQLENPNQATILVLLNPALDSISQCISQDFKRLIIIYNKLGGIVDQIKKTNECEFNLNHYTQNLTGTWVLTKIN